MIERSLREVDQMKPLIEYIQRNLKKGYKLDDLKWSLINQGYTRVSVQKAMDYVTELQEKQKPIKAETPKPEVMQVEPSAEEKQGFWQKIKSWIE